MKVIVQTDIFALFFKHFAVKLIVHVKIEIHVKIQNLYNIRITYRCTKRIRSFDERISSTFNVFLQRCC